MKVLFIVGVIGIGVIGIVAAANGMHRVLLTLEKRGYIYYREKPRGGGMAGAMFEMDKLTRPSIEHVVKLKKLMLRKKKLTASR